MDGYEGFVDHKQVKKISEKYFREHIGQKHALCLDFMQPAMSGEKYIPLMMGSTLPFFDGLNFRIENEKFQYNGLVIGPASGLSQTQLLEKVVKRYVNAPYLWGGRSPMGIDCSGFTQLVFRFLQIDLPRDAYQQATLGDILDFPSTARLGDLAFFENEKRKIVHVGIMQDADNIVHASGWVRRSRMDGNGILANDNAMASSKAKSARYTHKLKFIRRLL
jgi:hypothetical protein